MLVLPTLTHQGEELECSPSIIEGANLSGRKDEDIYSIRWKGDYKVLTRKGLRCVCFSIILVQLSKR